MPTQTATKRQTKPKGKASKEPVDAIATGSPRTVDDLLIALIDIVPGLNPRKDFDPIEMCNLADTITFHKGLLQPVIVRPNADGRYDLIAGERRFRCCRDHCKMTTIFARIVTCDAEMQAAITDDENRARVQLNPIEQAESLQRRFKASGKSQKAFGESIGISQGEVSSQLRLLQLPDEFRQMVISGEIVPSDARSVVPFIDLADVMAKCLDLCRKEQSDDETRISSDNFRRILAHSLGLFSRALTGGTWCKTQSCYLRIELDVTPEIRKSLDVRDCPFMYCNKSEPRAFNLAAWDAAQAKWQAEQDAMPTPDPKSKDSSGRDNSTPDPARVKRDLEWSLRRYRIKWTQRQIAHWLPSTDILFRIRLLMHFSVTRYENYFGKDGIQEILRSHAVEPVMMGGDSDVVDVFRSTANSDDVENVWISLLQYFVQQSVDWDASDGMTHEFLRDLAAEMEIDIKDWKCDREFLECVGDEQLTSLVKEWKLKKVPSKAEELIEFILSHTGLAVPACLLEIDICPPKTQATAGDENDDDPNFDTEDENDE